MKLCELRKEPYTIYPRAGFVAWCYVIKKKSMLDQRWCQQFHGWLSCRGC